MVIIRAVQTIAIRQAINQEIMDRLDMERLLDFGIRSDEEMNEDKSSQEKSETRQC